MIKKELFNSGKFKPTGMQLKLNYSGLTKYGLFISNSYKSKPNQIKNKSRHVGAGFSDK